MVAQHTQVAEVLGVVGEEVDVRGALYHQCQLVVGAGLVVFPPLIALSGGEEQSSPAGILRSLPSDYDSS